MIKSWNIINFYWENDIKGVSIKIFKLLLVSFFICNVSVAADKPIGYFG